LHNAWLKTLENNMLPKPTAQAPKLANLCGANLGGANLQYANLWEANLQGTMLSTANLQEAKLYVANLQGAKLRKTNLHKADLSDANLQSADLSQANLQGAVLVRANLQGANPSNANLQYANLWEVNLQGAGLYGTNLQGARLYSANLQDANLINANLTQANLRKANLSASNMDGVNLQQAKLINTALKEARFTNVDITEAVFMPVSMPDSSSLANLTGLLTVKLKGSLDYSDLTVENVSGLVLFRNALKEGGLRNLEREATYVIERWKTDHSPLIERWIKRIFLEFTTGYGLYYGRPIQIIIVLWFVFGFVYIAPVASCTKADSGIFRIWPKTDEEEKLSETKDVKILLSAFYFSLLSAFHFGWKDLNVGTWISRLQPRVYTLQARGWIRSVSGLQSLISVYMLAMWALTYFGRPFQ